MRGRAVNLLFYTRGLPGAGKTFWARQRLAIAARKGHRGSMARVNRDDLRAMLLDTGYREPEQQVEELITVAQDALIRALLGAGVSVIVDDTTLRDEHAWRLEGLARSCGAVPHVMDLRDVPWETCVARDTHRDRPVGAEVIRDMWLHHLASRKGLDD